MQNKLNLNLDNILKQSIIPIVTIDNIDHIDAIIDILLSININILEITLRTGNALNIIKYVAHKYPQIILGAGTILNVTQYQQSIDCGAQFIVAPGVTDSLIYEASKHSKILFLPGAITPTEIMHLLSYDFNYLKFFPAKNFNGYDILSSYINIFPQIKFCATGGIDAQNINQFLKLSNVANVGLSINQKMLDVQNYQAIKNYFIQILALII